MCIAWRFRNLLRNGNSLLNSSVDFVYLMRNENYRYFWLIRQISFVVAQSNQRFLWVLHIGFEPGPGIISQFILFVKILFSGQTQRDRSLLELLAWTHRVLWNACLASLQTADFAVCHHYYHRSPHWHALTGWLSHTLPETTIETEGRRWVNNRNNVTAHERIVTCRDAQFRQIISYKMPSPRDLWECHTLREH